MERCGKYTIRLWTLMLILILLLPGIGLAAKTEEFKPMQVIYRQTYYDETRNSWVQATGYVRNGGTIKVGPDGVVSIQVRDAFKGNYRVVITGTTTEGTPFEFNGGMKVYSDGGIGNCELQPTNQAGTYGPVTMEITSDSGERRRYDEVYFSLEKTADKYPYGFMHEEYFSSSNKGIKTEKGYILPAEFVTEEMTANTLTISNPLEGSVLVGTVGDRMHITGKIPRMTGKATFELRHKETKEVIASDKSEVQDYDSCYGEMIIEKPFISGDAYEIYAKCGDYEGLVNVTLVDLDAPVEGFVLPDLYYETDDRQKVYLSTLTPDENGALHIPHGSDGFLTLDIENNEAWNDIVFRSELKVKNLRGENATYVSERRGGGWGAVRVKVSTQAGEYGPIHLTFKAGGQSREYDLMVNVAETENSPYGANGLMHGNMRDAQIVEIPQGLVISSPVDGVSFSGKEGMKLDIYARGNHLEKPISFELKETATGRVLVSAPDAVDASTSISYDMFITSYFVSGGEYELTATSGEYSDSVRIYLRDEEMNPCQPYPAELAVKLNDYLAQMTTIEAGAEVDFEKYRFDGQDDGQGILGSFSVYQPWVEEDTWQREKDDLQSSANWTIYDLYRFQAREMGQYTDAQPIHTQVLTEAFGPAWQDVTGIRSAQGRAEVDGVQYLWIPVYYKDDQGGILEDRVYLYGVIATPGADMEYLEGKIFYHAPAEYRLEKLFIADQKWVADFIRQMDAQTGMLAVTAENKKYEKLSLGAQSLDVRKLQLKLIELGFMTASADGYYGEQTQEALKAYQEAAGLEVTGVADKKTQENLLSQKLEKELLNGWLQRHS